MVILFQNEDDDLIEAAVNRREGPALIRVVDPSHAQAFAQLECESRHQEANRSWVTEVAAKLLRKDLMREIILPSEPCPLPQRRA
jgi:hypothetical protein